ncbi:DUF4411 family protein [Legionella sp. 29fVS95]
MRLKIPTGCQKMDVECINLVEMFRKESLRS